MALSPTYEVSPDKKKRINELKKLAKAADTVWLASDEDREGEAISWHLCQALGLDPKTTKRIVFHEITKTAIEGHRQPAPRRSGPGGRPAGPPRARPARRL
jgi:DNA topoisomerase IA